MPGVTLDRDEMYPLYQVITNANFGIKMDINQETLDRWNKVTVDFYTVQREMEELYQKGLNDKYG